MKPTGSRVYEFIQATLFTLSTAQLSAEMSGPPLPKKRFAMSELLKILIETRFPPGQLAATLAALPSMSLAPARSILIFYSACVCVFASTS
jgi:hypothetical protein